VHQIEAGEIGDEFAALDGEGRRVLVTLARVEIQPIGRGATIALNGSCGSTLLSRALVS